MKANNFREPDNPPYTREQFIHGTMQHEIGKFNMGKLGSYDCRALLIARQNIQVRDNALEAARIAANRLLEENLGNNYLLRVRVYPHHVLRENKMIFGAHADRLQDGMRNAFGKPVGRAARIDTDQSIMSIHVDKDNIGTAKEALMRAKHKLPMKYKIIVEDIRRPKKQRY
jgi:large subunit ribosomal protein L10e